MKRELLLFACMFSFLPALALAGNAFGVEGKQLFNYGSWSNMELSDWPADARDLCEQHFNAVVDACRKSGYKNWAVRRLMGGYEFTPQRRNFGLDDSIMGPNKCDYYANSIDENRIISTTLNTMCSTKINNGVASSNQYSCTFTCTAWDCDSDLKPNEVAGCGVNSRFHPNSNSPDPFDWQTPGCKQDMRETCESRGKSCSLSRPCEVKQRKNSGGVVYCGCSCDYVPFESNFDAAAWDSKPRPKVDLDSFNLEQWRDSHKSSCDPTREFVSHDKDVVPDLVARKNDAIRHSLDALPKEAISLIGDGEVGIEIKDANGEKMDWTVTIQGGTVTQVSQRRSENPVLRLGTSRKVLDSITHSVDPANAAKLAISDGLIGFYSPDPLKNAAIGVVKANLLAKPAAKLGTFSVFYVTPAQMQIVLGNSYQSGGLAPVLDTLGAPAGFTSAARMNVVQASSLGFSARAGITPVGSSYSSPVTLSTGFSSARGTAAVISSGGGSHGNAALAGGFTAQQAYVGAQSFAASHAAATTTSYARIGGGRSR